MSRFLEAGHLFALALTALAIVTVPSRLRGLEPAARKRVVRALAIVVVVNQALYPFAVALMGDFSWQTSLPLNICDAAAFIAGAALWTERPLLVEVTYFWAFAGTIWGLLTPDVSLPFGSYAYIEYYLDHAGVILAALVLVRTLGRAPRDGAVLRVFTFTVFFVALVAVADLALGANYTNLREAPPGGNPLQLFGPWPWYLVIATLLAPLIFAVLDLPFRERRRHEIAAAG